MLYLSLVRFTFCQGNFSRCGEIGRHEGLKIPSQKCGTGSSPVSGTKLCPVNDVDTSLAGFDFLLFCFWSLFGLYLWSCKDQALFKRKRLGNGVHGSCLCRLEGMSVDLQSIQYRIWAHPSQYPQTHILRHSSTAEKNNCLFQQKWTDPKKLDKVFHE